MRVLFSILSYYPSFITTESINLGILFHDLKNDIRTLEVTSNWGRVKKFDDELDIDYMKAVLDGIRHEISDNGLFGHNSNYNLEDYISSYVNELQFSEVTSTDVTYLDDFIDETKKMFLRYDYDIKDRPNEKQKVNYMKEILTSNDIDYSSKKTVGAFEENIRFDYIVGNYAFKMFTFEDKRIASQIFPAKSWAYTAKTLEDKYRVVFVYDIDREEDSDFKKIVNILEQSSYKMMKFDEAVEFILKLNDNKDLLAETVNN